MFDGVLEVQTLIKPHPTFDDMVKMKLSDLVELALRDLALVEQDTEHFHVNMDTWVRNDSYSSKCDVCLAGAVFVQISNPRHVSSADMLGDTLHPLNMNTRSVMLALNYLRMGHVNYALQCLDRPGRVAGTPLVAHTLYAVDPVRWRACMKHMVASLRTQGL